MKNNLEKLQLRTKFQTALNLVRCFLLHSTNFQYFFMDSKVNCQIHMISDMFKNIWKEYFIKESFWSERNILRVQSYCLAVPGVQSSHAYMWFIQNLGMRWLHSWTKCGVCGCVHMRLHTTHSQASIYIYIYICIYIYIYNII